jgi:two-component system, LytTR family, sensor kinase
MRFNSDSLRRVLAGYLLSFAVWFALALLLAYQMYISMEPRQIDAAHRMFYLLPFARFFCFAFLTPPLFWFSRRFPIGVAELYKRLPVYILGAIGFMVSYSVLRVLVFPTWDVTHQQWVARGAGSIVAVIVGTVTDQMSTYVGVIAIAHAYEFFQRSRRSEIENVELQQALAASELQMLKMQLRPHFLFNTLHGIGTLVDSDAQGAKQMLVRLSELLRITFEHDSADLVSLGEEMRIVSSYLDIEKMRLGDRLQVRYEIPGELTGYLVPQLILQPLIENAIVHGVACARGGGWIEVKASRNEQRLELTITNSVDGRPQRRNGVGLQNVKSRLQYLYRHEAESKFVFANQNTAIASIEIPALFERSVPAWVEQDPAPRMELQT